MRRGRYVVIVIWLVANTGAADAELQQATVTGVVSDEGGLPVGQAVVRLECGQPPDATSTIADAEGRFVFDDVRPGRCTARATKPGYVGGTYGAIRPGGQGMAVVAVGDRVLGPLSIVLSRASSIAGTVTGESGYPVGRVEVAAFPVTAAAAAAAAAELGQQPAATARPDERGRYRLAGLLAGNYVVVAASVLQGSHEVLQPLAAAPSGIERRILVPTFHPGTADASTATPVGVQAGEVRSGVDIRLLVEPVGRIEGRITTEDGTPLPPVTVRLEREAMAGQWPPHVQPPFAGPDREGGFSADAVVPARYRLVASSTGTPGPSSRVDWWGEAPVSVPPAGTAGVTVMLRRGLVVSGQVVGDLADAPWTPSTWAVVLRPVPPEESAAGVRAGGRWVGQLQPGGQFRVDGLRPGRYIATIASPDGETCSVERVRQGEREIDDDVVVVADDQAEDAVLTCSARGGSVSGALQTPAGDPAPGYVVVVYPKDARAWRRGSSRIRAMRSGADGGYVFDDLLSGAYLIGVVTATSDIDWEQPAFLETFATSSVGVDLQRGEAAVLDLVVNR